MNQPDTSTIEGKIAVMQAFAEGKNIEWKTRPDNCWHRSLNPQWDWVGLCYRIAEPEPRQWNARLYRLGNDGYLSILPLDAANSDAELVRVVELLPGWKLVREDEA